MNNDLFYRTNTQDSLEVVFVEDPDNAGEYFDFDLTAILPPFARRIYVGTAGNIAAKKVGDADFIVYKNVPACSYLDGAWTTIRKVGTTAADLVAEQ